MGPTDKEKSSGAHPGAASPPADSSTEPFLGRDGVEKACFCDVAPAPPGEDITAWVRVVASRWLIEEATEMANEKGGSDRVIDAALDAVGVCFVTLCSLPRAEVVKGFQAYKNSQTQRGRDISMPHQKMIDNAELAYRSFAGNFRERELEVLTTKVRSHLAKHKGLQPLAAAPTADAALGSPGAASAAPVEPRKPQLIPKYAQRAQEDSPTTVAPPRRDDIGS